MSMFFKGNNLEDELSFVYYYHSQKYNQILHLVSIPVVFFGLLIITSQYSVFTVPLNVIITIVYTAFYVTLDATVAMGWLGVFVLENWAIYSYGLGGWSLPVVLVGLVIMPLSLQGVGHSVYEKRLPAFRLFEAAVTTPFFILFNFFFLSFGYRAEYMRGVIANSSKWKGSELHRSLF